MSWEDYPLPGQTRVRRDGSKFVYQLVGDFTWDAERGLLWEKFWDGFSTVYAVAAVVREDEAWRRCFEAKWAWTLGHNLAQAGQCRDAYETGLHHGICFGEEWKPRRFNDCPYPAHADDCNCAGAGGDR